MDKKDKRNHYDAAAPDYDHRSHDYFAVGNYHGVGKSYPHSHEGNPKVEGIPMGIKITDHPHEKS